MCTLPGAMALHARAQPHARQQLGTAQNQLVSVPRRCLVTPVRRQNARVTKAAALPDALSAAGTALASSPGLSPEQVQVATYWTLGLAGASFVATFFVAPRFKDQFKEAVDWRDVYAALSASGARAVDPAEAAAKSNRCVYV